MLKVAIVISLVAMLASLFSGLVFLSRDGTPSSRMLKALVVRVSLAVLTITLVAWDLYTR